MEKNIFDLDLQVNKVQGDIDDGITSKSLCTPGCISGVLQCATKGCSLSCNSCVNC